MALPLAGAESIRDGPKLRARLHPSGQPSLPRSQGHWRHSTCASVAEPEPRRSRGPGRQPTGGGDATSPRPEADRMPHVGSSDQDPKSGRWNQAGELAVSQRGTLGCPGRGRLCCCLSWSLMSLHVLFVDWVSFSASHTPSESCSGLGIPAVGEEVITLTTAISDNCHHV